MTRTLEKAEKDKKCFRLVGDVLVERTVADVLPAVTKNCANLQAVIQDEAKHMQAKEQKLQVHIE